MWNTKKKPSAILKKLKLHSTSSVWCTCALACVKRKKKEACMTAVFNTNTVSQCEFYEHEHNRVKSG